MKIAVLGAGSIGTLIAGKLANSKLAEVLVHARGEHAAKLALDGIYITGHQELKIPPDDYQISIADVMTNDIFDGAADYVLISSKANQVENLFEVAKRMCHLDTKVMVISNGLGHIEKCKDTFGPHRTIAATTTHGAWRPSAGVVNWAGIGAINLGELPHGAQLSEIQDFVELLEQVGLNPNLQSDGMAMIWSKILLNIAINPIAAITGLSNGALLEDEMFETCVEVMLEGAKIARLEGIATLDDATLIDNLRVVLEATSTNQCSMLQDVRQGSVTEIQFLNRQIVDRAEKYGVSTPLNQLLSKLVESITSY
jgi:2-dehydropantoate 2-reductase